MSRQERYDDKKHKRLLERILDGIMRIYSNTCFVHREILAENRLEISQTPQKPGSG